MMGILYLVCCRCYVWCLWLFVSLFVSLFVCVVVYVQVLECKVFIQEYGLWMLFGCIFEVGSFCIEEQMLVQFDYDDDGLVVVWVGDSFYYVNWQGCIQVVIMWDNGLDLFVEGLMCGCVGVCIGYFDVCLGQVFLVIFDFGWLFIDGIVQVCNGCCCGLADVQGYILMEGGEWFYIDCQGCCVFVFVML